MTAWRSKTILLIKLQTKSCTGFEYSFDKTAELGEFHRYDKSTGEASKSECQIVRILYWWKKLMNVINNMAKFKLL